MVRVLGGSPWCQLLGRSILLGLKLLVAAEIIRTVAVTPTFESVGVLAIIVLIRTFLSFSLELEIAGPCRGKRSLMWAASQGLRVRVRRPGGRRIAGCARR